MIPFAVTTWAAFLSVVIAHSIRRRSPLVVASPRGVASMNLQYGIFFFALSFAIVVELAYHVEALRFMRIDPFHFPACAPLQIAGAALLALSFGLYLATLRFISPNYFPFVGVRVDQGLTTTGPYALVRHPLYTAQIGMMCGTGMVFQNLVFAVLPLVFCFFYRTSREEERLLAERFPEYARYMATTKRFVPWVF